MNISARQLRAFVSVARLRSFTRAAEQLHITQAGLSAIVREVEQQFDCRLFDRTTRMVALTEAGAQLLPSAERVLAELASAAAALGRTRAQARRLLTVAVTPVVAAGLFPEVCEAFAARQPGVVPRIRDADRAQVQAMVERGEADAGFGSFLASSTGIERQLLFRCRLLAAAAPGTLGLGPAAPGALPALPWRALRNAPLLALPAHDTTQQLIDRHLAPLGRSDSERPAYNSMHTLIAMAAGGQGVAIVPSFALPTLRRFGVDVARLRDPAVEVDFFRITRKGREPPPAIDAFVDALKAVAAQRCGVRA